MALVSELEGVVEAIPRYRDLEIVDEPKVLVRDSTLAQKNLRAAVF